MMTGGCMDFGKRCLSGLPQRLRVLEVGSRNINGSFRGFVKNPCHYLGIDIVMGEGVDMLCNVYNMSVFDDYWFDLLICTEVLEHLLDWKKAITEMARVVRPGGWMILTTRSPGFPKHDWPDDFWRFTRQDFKSIFNFLDNPIIESDHESEPGIFVFGRGSLRPPDIAAIHVDGYARGVV